MTLGRKVEHEIRRAVDGMKHKLRHSVGIIEHKVK